MASEYHNVDLRVLEESSQRFDLVNENLDLRIDTLFNKSAIYLVFSRDKEVVKKLILNDPCGGCYQLGKRSLLISNASTSISPNLEYSAVIGGNDALSLSYLLHFPSENDLTTFQRKLHELQSSKSHTATCTSSSSHLACSNFDRRTDSWSAVQYFQFYSYLSQQQNMMQDYVRTATYQQAVLQNSVDFRNKVVLDVGAGSGILSFFAVQAGARKVYAVEASNMADHCEQMVRGNKLAGKILVYSGKIEEMDQLPELVDVIISEPMGYMLFNERMLESYIHARKFLRPGGLMFPTVANLYVAPFTDEGLFMEQNTKADFWYQQSFYGVDLSCLREAAVREYFHQPVVDTFNLNICMAVPQVYRVDFLTAAESDLVLIDMPLTFDMYTSGTVHGLAFWFDVGFVGSQKEVWLSTGPTEPLTHWYQVRCLFETPLFVQEGQTVHGRVVMSANSRQSYDVDIELTIPGTMSKVSNTLDLKNPYFRYTGQPAAPPPGSQNKSPTETYYGGLGLTPQLVGRAGSGAGPVMGANASAGQVCNGTLVDSVVGSLMSVSSSSGAIPSSANQQQSSVSTLLPASLMIGDYAAQHHQQQSYMTAGFTGQPPPPPPLPVPTMATPVTAAGLVVGLQHSPVVVTAATSGLPHYPSPYQTSAGVSPPFFQ